MISRSLTGLGNLSVSKIDLLGLVVAASYGDRTITVVNNFGDVLTITDGTWYFGAIIADDGVGAVTVVADFLDSGIFEILDSIFQFIYTRSEIIKLFVDLVDLVLQLIVFTLKVLDVVLSLVQIILYLLKLFW